MVFMFVYKLLEERIVDSLCLCGAYHNMGDIFVYFCNLENKLVLSRNKNIQKANDKASK